MPRADGRITTHALGELQARGTLFVRPQEDTYNGMVIGECSRGADMEVPPSLSFIHLRPSRWFKH
jgi:GTP-binding protein